MVPRLDNTREGVTMMKMYFHTGPETHVLFYEWDAKSIGAVIGTCCAVFVVSVFYEGLKLLRAHVQAGSVSSSMVRTRADSEVKNLLAEDNNSDHTFNSSISSYRHLVQTLLHMVQATLSYSLMLVFMTFNLWFCLALVLGLGTGYFLFGSSRDTPADELTQHCH